MIPSGSFRQFQGDWSFLYRFHQWVKNYPKPSAPATLSEQKWMMMYIPVRSEKDLNARIFSSALVVLLFLVQASILYCNEIAVRLHNSSQDQTRISLTFENTPEFYYYMRPVPLALVLVLEGAQQLSRRIYYKEPHVARIELESVSTQESHLVIQLKGEPLIKVTSLENHIKIELTARPENTIPQRSTSSKAVKEVSDMIIPDLPQRDFIKLSVPRLGCERMQADLILYQAGPAARQSKSTAAGNRHQPLQHQTTDGASLSKTPAPELQQPTVPNRLS